MCCDDARYNIARSWRWRNDVGTAPRASVGLTALATDRAGEPDFRAFLAPFGSVDCFTTRLVMDQVATPDTLAAMAPHLENAARLLVPGSPLDVIAYSCTSGTVAIGLAGVEAAMRRARPGIGVATPVQAACEGLAALGARKVFLLTPYTIETADLIANYFIDAGLVIDHAAAMGLAGDPEMNRVSARYLIEAGEQIMQADSDALFISCTGLNTVSVVDELESRISEPVVTSNQALAWQALRLAGVGDAAQSGGRLCRDV